MDTGDPYILKNDRGEFVLESDSIDIIYNFYGENAPINIGIHNKMSKPIYVDWRKSGLIIDNKSVTFKTPIDVYATEADTSSMDYARFLNDPEGLGFIKPYSRVKTQVLELANFRFHKIPESKFEKNHTEIDEWGQKKKYKNIIYSENDSPLYLETFITIYEKANDMSLPLYFDTYFYVSELIRGDKANPSKFKAMRDKQGNYFFVRKENNSSWKKVGKSSLKVLGVAALVTSNIVVWALDVREY